MAIVKVITLFCLFVIYRGDQFGFRISSCVVIVFLSHFVSEVNLRRFRFFWFLNANRRNCMRIKLRDLVFLSPELNATKDGIICVYRSIRSVSFIGSQLMNKSFECVKCILWMFKTTGCSFISVSSDFEMLWFNSIDTTTDNKVRLKKL